MRNKKTNIMTITNEIKSTEPTHTTNMLECIITETEECRVEVIENGFTDFPSGGTPSQYNKLRHFFRYSPMHIRSGERCKVTVEIKEKPLRWCTVTYELENPSVSDIICNSSYKIFNISRRGKVTGL